MSTPELIGQLSSEITLAHGRLTAILRPPPDGAGDVDKPPVFLYNMIMGRPRTRNVAMVNGRITVEQMEWLQKRADALGGNLSAALRQAITDARLLEMARDDYKLLRLEHPEFRIPRNQPPIDDSRTLEVVLVMPMSDVDDVELRKEEGASERPAD